MTEPFDPTDPLNRVADALRRAVSHAAVTAIQSEDAQQLTEVERLQGLMAGMTVGLVGACLCCVTEEGWDDIVQAIVDYLPQAREQATAIIAATKAGRQ